MLTDDKKIIIPGVDELSLHLPKKIELEEASKVDFSFSELFPSPEELDGKSALTVLFLTNMFLSQLSKIWLERSRLTNNRLLSLEREVKLLKRRLRKASL